MVDRNDEVSKLSEPRTISDWPDSLQKVKGYSKVPSKIHYSSEKDGEKTTEKITWGFSVPNNVEPIEWFKLMLLDEEDLPDYLRTSDYYKKTKAKIEGLEKKPYDVVRDYLRCLWTHARKEILSAIGMRLFATCPFLVVLSVPVTWKDYAAARLAEASRHAGISGSQTTIGIISEPEAAILASLRFPKDQVKKLAQDDTILVVDAGGGTVYVSLREFESCSD